MVVARSQLAVGILILLVIAGATLALAVSLLSGQREAEATLLRARGASRSQLTRTGLAEAVLLVVPAAVLGPILGGLLLPVLTRHGPLAHSGLRLGVAFPAVAWLASVAAAVGCAVVIARTWLNAAQSPGRERAQRGRQRALAAAARTGVDLALVALAVLAGWQLAHYKAPVTAGLAGTIGVDPILVSAPVLALTAAAVLMLRLLPAVARIGDRAAARGRDLTAAVAAWQISRRPVRQAGPVLLAVLAVATSFIAVAEWTSWQRSVQDQASFTTGADLRVDLPPAAPLPLGRLAITHPGARRDRQHPGGPVPARAAQLGHSPAARAGHPAGGIRCHGASRPGRWIPGRGLRPAGPADGARRPAGPGRPARLMVTATLTGSGVSQAVLFAGITDAFGVPYQVQVGLLPADGRPHTLTVAVSTGQRRRLPAAHHRLCRAVHDAQAPAAGWPAGDHLGPRRRRDDRHRGRPVRARAPRGAAEAVRQPWGSGQPGGPARQARRDRRDGEPHRHHDRFRLGCRLRAAVASQCGIRSLPVRRAARTSTLPSTVTVTAATPPAAIPAAVTQAFAAAVGTRPGAYHPGHLRGRPHHPQRS